MMLALILLATTLPFDGSPWNLSTGNLSVSFIQASVHTQNASSLVIYLGILIGGGAGAIIGALGADGAESDMAGAPMAEEAKH